MQTTSDTHLIEQLDSRLRDIIMSAQTASDRGCLTFILKHVNAEQERKRDALWDHYYRHAAVRIKDHIARLKAVYETVAAELAARPKPTYAYQRLRLVNPSADEASADQNR